MTPRGLLNPTRPECRPTAVRLPAVLVLLAGVLALTPSTAHAEDPCAVHFPKLRAVVTASGPDRPVPAADKAALVEELAIERLLWEDEVAHQHQRLGTVDPAIARVAVERLDRLAADVGQVLTSLGHSLDTDTALDAAVTDRVLACAGNGGLVPRWPIASAAPSPLPPLPRRTPAPGQPAPPGYFDPPAGPGAGTLAGEGTIAPLRLATASEGEEPADPVAAKASELGHDPVAIYGFVRDSIRAEHYHGSAKSPATVLASGSGNDADQSGLLAALLRAAGLPARLVWGVVELPQAALLGHLAVTGTTALEQAMTSAGIPWTPVIEGGQPVAYRLDRVWAEVWLPYANFRGVLLDRSGTTWVPLDPEMKAHLPGTTRRILEEMTLDAAGLRTEYLSGALCGDDLTLPDACPALRDVLIGRVDQYLQDHGDTERWDSLAVPPRLPVRDEPILPPTLAGLIVAVHGWGIDLPESLTHRITLTAQAAGVTLLETTLPVSALAGRGAVVWYAPATPDDATIVEAYGGYLWDVPPYLLNLTPVITAGSEELARGTAGVGMGRPFDLATLLTTPGGQTTSFVNAALAGVPVGIGIAPGRQGYQPAGSEPVNTVEMLSLLATEYLDQTETFRTELAAIDGLAVVHPYPSVAAVASVVAVQGSLGIVTGLAWQGVVVDADLDGSEIAGRTVAVRARWHILAGLQASTLERRIFESREITSVTADKALMLASLAGTPIVHITKDNLQTALDALPYDATIEAEIAAWVLGGGEADIPETPQALLAWQGVGYLLTDPATGQARYQLAGALSGGMTVVPAELLPPLFREKPSNVGVNTNPAEAARIDVYGTHSQQLVSAEVGTTLSGREALTVVVRDRERRRVRGAQVTFVLVAGGGSVASTTATTDNQGLASTNFTLGQKTGDDPYYVKLKAADLYATQCGLNVVSASIPNAQLASPFYILGFPGPLHVLHTPFSTSSQGLPNMSLELPLVVVPRDQYDNPISNQSVTFTLQEPVPDPSVPDYLEKGPLLIKAEYDCKSISIGRECVKFVGTDQLQAVVDTGTYTGVWVRLVLGPPADMATDKDYHVETRATRPDGSSEVVSFVATAVHYTFPSGHQLGEPVLITVGRGQPVSFSDATKVVEAYRPGDQSYPFEVDVIAVRQKVAVEACAGCSKTGYKTTPLSDFNTWRMKPNSPLSSCSAVGGSCSEVDPRQATAEVTFTYPTDGGAARTTMTEMDVFGHYSLGVRAPSAPGKYTVITEVRAFLPSPKRPAGGQPDEVYPCPLGASCGAEMEWRFFPETPTVGPSFTLWSVKAHLTEPLPWVVLDHRGSHTVETPLPFTILPTDYPAAKTSVLFLEAGKEVAWADCLASCGGEVKLGVGKFFAAPDSPTHAARIVLNRGGYWQPRRHFDQSLEIRYEQQPLQISRVKIVDERRPAGQQEVQDDEWVLITPVPEMPGIKASFTQDIQKTATYSLTLHDLQLRGGRVVHDHSEQAGPFSADTSSSWTPFQSASWGSMFRGGFAALKYEVGGVVKGTHFFQIGGTNPSIASAEAAIGDQPWYRLPIVRWETGCQPAAGGGSRPYNQFHEAGRSANEYLPIWGTPNGWGMMQLDPPPSEDVLWNWADNVAGGLQVLATKSSWAQQYFDYFRAHFPQQFEDPPSWNGDVSAVDASTVVLYNGASVLYCARYNSSGKCIGWILSAFEFVPMAPSGSRWVYKANRNRYLENVYAEYQNPKCR